MGGGRWEGAKGGKEGRRARKVREGREGDVLVYEYSVWKQI